MKNFFLAIVLCFSAFHLQAQISGVGFRPIFSMSTYKLSKDLADTYDAGLRPGGGFAAFVEINLGERFTVQPEVVFMQRGGNLNSESSIYWDGPEFGYPNGYEVVDYRLKETLKYVDVPIMFEKNFGGGSLGAYVSAGPAFSFAIGNGRGLEEITVEYADEGEIASSTDRSEYAIEMGKDRYDMYKGYDLSINVGTGLVFILERGEIGFDLRYAHGLKALNTDGLKNRNFQVGLSYMHYFGN